MKTYGQFCGLARAADVIGERWSVLIVRDLLIGPRRFGELADGLPGIPSNILTSRLRTLEAAGVVERALPEEGGRGVHYRLTAYGRDLEPILLRLGTWGARRMAQPHEGEVVTQDSLAAALLSGFTGSVAAARTFQVDGPGASAHATVAPPTASGAATIAVAGGPHPAHDLAIGGPGLRLVLAGLLDPEEGRREGALAVSGDPALLAEFTAAFRVPLDQEPSVRDGAAGYPAGR